MRDEEGAKYFSIWHECRKPEVGEHFILNGGAVFPALGFCGVGDPERFTRMDDCFTIEVFTGLIAPR